MLNNEFDLTYYTPVICRIILKKNRLKYNNYNFTLPKKLLKDNEIDEPLPYYRIGNWKTKEIFKLGKVTKNFNNNNKVQYIKNVSKSAVNRLNLNKHDILRIRLNDDIIQIEKIDDIYNNKSIYITHLTRHSGYETQLLIPAIICNDRTSINLDFLGDTLLNITISKQTNIISLPNKLIEKNKLTKDTKLICTIQGNKLTVEKLDI